MWKHELGLAHIALFREQVDSAIVYLKQAWSAIKHPEWVYPPTKEIVTNIMESMYVLTGRLLAKLGDPLGALQFLAALEWIMLAIRSIFTRRLRSSKGF